MTDTSNSKDPVSFARFSGACDCHLHVLDPAFPVVANAQVPNVRAPVENYFPFARRIGTSRAVIVQPSLYGTRNDCTLNALAAFDGRARAIVVIDESTPTDSFRRWTELGVRGIRFNQVQAGATTMAMMRPLAERMAPFGWHIQLHIKAKELPQYEDLLASLPVDLVLDHAGRVALPEYEKDPGWPVILRLLDKGRTWVKLSGPYHEDRAGAPDYRNAVAMGRRLVAAAEDRMLFGSDWPHVTEKTAPNPEDLCRYLIACTNGDAQLGKILVSNPRTLYGFAA
jgi:predicted TIM-barrel fold metal-dependent hydrolase